VIIAAVSSEGGRADMVGRIGYLTTGRQELKGERISLSHRPTRLNMCRAINHTARRRAFYPGISIRLRLC
jgi:hypothetical protein